MEKRFFPLILWVIFIRFFCLQESGVAATIENRYIFIDLSKADDGWAIASDINNKGEIVGTFIGPTGMRSRGFLYSEGRRTDLSVGPWTLLYAINNVGQVVGASGPALSQFQPFLRHETSTRLLGSLSDTDSTVPSDMNDLGEIIISTLNGGKSSVFRNGAIQGFRDLGGRGRLTGINNSGQIVGGYEATTGFHAFLYQDGHILDLDPNRQYSIANSINEQGDIVGDRGAGAGAKAFLFSNGRLTDIPMLGGRSWALKINTHQQIVGYTDKKVNGSSWCAILYENDTAKDLNELAINLPSGVALAKANSINDVGQIVGEAKMPSGDTHAFLLNPISRPLREEIAQSIPVKPVYGPFPVREPSKDKLVVLTHGWINRFFSPLSPGNESWLDSMSNNLARKLSQSGQSDWQVFAYKWVDAAWKFAALDTLQPAQQEGVNLGSAVAIQGWKHVHLIGHSAGAQLIHEAAQWIKARGITVHCTFLDPYTGNDEERVKLYGEGTDWSENYFSHDVTGGSTEQLLKHAYNVDVTRLGPKRTLARFRSSETGEMEICTQTIKYHSWPVDFYVNTITNALPGDEYKGFGFPLSKAGGNWHLATNNYLVGNTVATKLGEDDPDCDPSQNLNQFSGSNTTVNPIEFPTFQSFTGKVEKTPDAFKLFSGSPVWLNFAIYNTNTVNTIEFKCLFSSDAGAAGLLRVFWDTNIIGAIDETLARPALAKYQFAIPSISIGSVHTLGFRLDTFSDVQSITTITNLNLRQFGASKQAALAVERKTQEQWVYRILGEPGFDYIIEVSTDLSEWTEIATVETRFGEGFFRDLSAETAHTRYYRAFAR